jgi:hypothetical protein
LPDLDEVHRIACRARDCIRSLAVAVRAGSIPETGEPTGVPEQRTTGLSKSLGALWIVPNALATGMMLAVSHARR